MYFVSKDLGYFDIISASTDVSSLRLFTGATSGDPYSTGSVRAYITADTGNTVTLANQAASPWLQYNGSTGFVTIYGNCGTTGTFAGTSATFSGAVTISSSTASTSTTTGALIVTGGIGAGGSIYAASFFESSDKRVKTLIEDNFQAKGIETIIPKLYTKNDKVELGYYAQDVQGILNSAVSEDEKGMLSLSYREVHTAKIYALELEIKELKELIKSLIK
jgi:hypothetical protein